MLLHVCCAPCATYPLEVLEQNFAVTAYFYDPNIHPRAEYEKRLAEARKYFRCRRSSGTAPTKLIEAEYDDKRWFELTEGLENEPEKGKRCEVCYEMRLRQTAKYATANGFDYFTAALSVSPHKDASLINQLGTKLAAEFGVNYLPADWKKSGGFDRGVALARAADLARQDYCGCAYSKAAHDAKKATNANR
jgi:predicted adenine nucleotide alpha hydrolase (AANH) superfamily ATPase